MSLRLEKNWGTWAREYRPIYGPYEAQMGRFVSLKKNEFIGHEAARQERQDGGPLSLTVFTVDTDDVDVIGDEPIWHDGKVVGWVTSGGYGHYVGKSRLPWATCRVRMPSQDDGFEIEIIGNRYARQTATRATVRSASRAHERIRPC